MRIINLDIKQTPNYISSLVYTGFFVTANAVRFGL